MIRTMILAAALAVVPPVSAQTATGFEQANTRAEAQKSSQPDATSEYADVWANFNNQHDLDERDGCYFKAEGELIQILEIDRSGKVVGYFADKDNARARCWERTYLGVEFPPPPFAPYWQKLVMH